MPKRVRASNRKTFLSNLIRTGYLPDEVPPFVTTKYFSQFCLSEYAFLESQAPRNLNLSTSYARFTAPRTNKGRRQLALVHPIAQATLSMLITQHRSEIKNIIKSRPSSLYSVEEDLIHNRAFIGLRFRHWEEEKAKLYSRYKFIMQADISRFFYTIYTHSIPWAVLGKEKAKHLFHHNKAKLKNHWSNKLDMAIQATQARETFGLPVGPDTSRIIAELILARVENEEAYAEVMSGGRSVRLLDDFDAGFDTEAIADSALAALRTELWRYNLQINEEKSRVCRSREIFRPNWRREMSRFAIAEHSESSQRQDIRDYVDLTLDRCLQASVGGPASWACNRLSRVNIFPANLALVLNSMYRLSRDYPYCLPLVCSFIINNRYIITYSKQKKKLVDWVKQSLRTHCANGDDIETAWLLFVCGVLKIDLEPEALPHFGSQPNPIVFSMLGLLREKKVLSVPLQNWPWRSTFIRTGAIRYTLAANV